jgi:beta-glucanase (GH16 family)
MTAPRTVRRVTPAAALACLALAALAIAPAASAYAPPVLDAPGAAPASAAAGTAAVSAAGPRTVAAAATPTVTAAAAVHPSGLAPAKVAPRGWKRYWVDDFATTAVSSAWDKYNGYPGGYSNGWWAPSHVRSTRGMLVLDGFRQGGKFVTGGVSATRRSSLLYGKYLVRMRADSGIGVGYVALLWPTKGGWPPEVDFAEDAGRSRTTTSGTSHFSASNRQLQKILRVDFTKWHTVGVEWTPTALKYTIDGRVWATMTGAAVPHVPMHLAIQSAALKCTSWSACVSSATPAHVNIYVDWVDIYRRA